MPATAKPTDIYSQVLGEVFSGRLAPGDKLVERKLAEQLGVSRVPIREALMRLVAQGVLVGGEKGQGTRVRHYSPTEVRQLFQFREMVEGGAAYSAALSRSEDDLIALQMICDSMESLQDSEPDVGRWGQLDHKFHKALAAASHQERFIQQMKTLLAEAHFVFFNLEPAFSKDTDEPARELMSRVSQEHQQIVDMVKTGDADSAEQAARTHIRPLADRATRSRIESGLTEYQTDQAEQQEQEEKELECV